MITRRVLHFSFPIYRTFCQFKRKYNEMPVIRNFIAVINNDM